MFVKTYQIMNNICMFFQIWIKELQTNLFLYFCIFVCFCLLVAIQTMITYAMLFLTNLMIFNERKCQGIRITATNTSSKEGRNKTNQGNKQM